MNIILLSGGSGKRLWPLSNDVRSKQFLKLFKNDKGEYESMLQRMYHQIQKIDKNAKVTIATSKNQVHLIENQLNDKVGISIEPYRRDTFPAIALASCYLKDVEGVSEDESVVVCPVDPYVNDDYFKCIDKLGKLAKKSKANLVLMGIEPTFPSEKFGYIIPTSKDAVSKVSSFKEKPSEKVAKDYIKKGGLWNGGVFAYRLGYVLKKAHELIDFKDYQDLFDQYETLNKISFDYAVVEKEKEIEVMRFKGIWKDLGTWNTLTEVLKDNTIGDATIDDQSKNVHVINELDIPIISMGLKDVIISASPDGILVADKEASSNIKPYVEKLDQEAKFGEKSWGSYKVMDVEKESETLKVTLNPGNKMNYHSHEHRDEVWVVISGTGYTIVDGMAEPIKAGDVVTMEKGVRHTVIAETELKLIEVQLGKEISVNDKKKYPLED